MHIEVCPLVKVPNWSRLTFCEVADFTCVDTEESGTNVKFPKSLVIV